MKARLTPSALEDIDRVTDWYDRKRDGLGLEFTERVLESIEKTELSPFGYVKVYGETRKAELVQFPYNLWFRIEDEAIVIASWQGSERQALSNFASQNPKSVPR